LIFCSVITASVKNVERTTPKWGVAELSNPPIFWTRMF
jgi:hypothetical protein